MERTMRMVVMVSIMAACGGGQRPGRPNPQQSSGYEPAPSPPESADKVCDDSAARSLARLRDLAKRDPARALVDLGVDGDDLDKAAASVLAAWSLTHEESSPSAVNEPEKANPPPPTPPIPSPDEDKPWWCASFGVGYGECKPTRKSCEEMRASAQARAEDASECQRQARAACYRERYVLAAKIETFCAPTIATCKDHRRFMAAHFSDDVRVISECAPK